MIVATDQPRPCAIQAAMRQLGRVPVGGAPARPPPLPPQPVAALPVITKPVAQTPESEPKPVKPQRSAQNGRMAPGALIKETRARLKLCASELKSAERKSAELREEHEFLTAMLENSKRTKSAKIKG